MLILSDFSRLLVYIMSSVFVLGFRYFLKIFSLFYSYDGRSRQVLKKSFKYDKKIVQFGCSEGSVMVGQQCGNHFAFISEYSTDAHRH